MACRYDVSLDVNVMGVKHLCHFAKQCANLKMLMHVSTGQFLQCIILYLFILAANHSSRTHACLQLLCVQLLCPATARR